MRALAAQGAKPCPNEIPSDLLAANCIPPGFMVQTGWDIVCDYYQVPRRQTIDRASVYSLLPSLDVTG